MTRRARLLPLLVAVAGLALAARLADVWQGFAVLAQDRPMAQARPMPLVPAVGEQEPAPGESAAANAGQAPEQSAGTATSADGLFELPPDPLSMTDEEVDLLQSLARRREELELRARRVDEREVLLQAAERRIEEKVADLTALQKNIETLLQQHQEQTESQYQSLVKIYENMKPKDAARIFEELDMAILLPVIERMKERKTAPILAKMDAEKAKAITTELAERRKLPKPGNG